MALQWKSGGGADLPNGGTKGQALVKKSDANQDVEWGDAGSGIVDQTYDPTSTNAQSGTAVAEALEGVQIPSGWGIAKVGYVSVNIGSTGKGSLTVDISELGFSSQGDYAISLTVVGGTGDWGQGSDWIGTKTATEFQIGTYGAENIRKDFMYAIIGKGYGDNVSGWGVAKVINDQISGSSEYVDKPYDISDLGFTNADDYTVTAIVIGGASGYGGKTVFYIKEGTKTATGFELRIDKASGSTVKYQVTIIAKGYGGSGGPSGLPGGGTTGQMLTKISDDDGAVAWRTPNPPYSAGTGIDTTELESNVIAVDDTIATKTDVATAKSEVEADLTAGLATKQDTLVSGENIKTINNNSLLGEGNLWISAAPAMVITEEIFSYTEAQNNGYVGTFTKDVSEFDELKFVFGDGLFGDAIYVDKAAREMSECTIPTKLWLAFPKIGTNAQASSIRIITDMYISGNQKWFIEVFPVYTSSSISKTQFKISRDSYTPSGNQVVKVYGIKHVRPFDYTPGEREVGSWIDGSPIFQQTIDLGIITTPETLVNHNIADIDTIVDIKSIVIDDTNHSTVTLANYPNAFADRTQVMTTTQGNHNHQITTLQYTKII